MTYIQETQNLRDRVTAALNLGDTSDAIHDRLLALDITGQQHNAVGCPLAVAVRTAMPEVDRVIVGAAYIVFRIGERVYRTLLPAAASEFVTRFDAGVYLDLITPAEVTR